MVEPNTGTNGSSGPLPAQDSPPRGTANEGYKPALWERILAAVCAVAILVVVFIVVLRKTPFTDANQVVLIRIVLSLAVSIIGAVVPGFLQVGLTGKGVMIRAGGALALFIVTYFFSPKVLPLNVKEQLQKIQKSTEETQNQVGRIITKFNSIFVQAVYELPQTEPEVKELRDSLVEISQKVRGANSPLPRGLGLSYSDSGDRKPDPPIVSVDLDQLSQADFARLAPKLLELDPLITFLKQPRLQLAINRSSRDKSLLVDSFLGHSDPPDLRLYAHAWPVDPPNGRFGKIILDPRGNRLLVSWNGFDYPPDKWSTSLKVTSIHDLNQAQLVVMLSGTGNIDERIDKIAAGSVPVWLNIKFDQSFVTFVDLERLDPVLTWQAFMATFPDAATILDGKASHTLDPAYGWGF